jgi:hypothetical protein
MVQSFSRAFQDSGVHAGLIRVEGIVTPESKVLNPLNIAKETFKFYEAGEGLDLKLKE